MGSLHAFHHHPVMMGVWYVTYILWVVPEIVLSRRLRPATDAQKVDRGSKLVVYVTMFAGIFSAYLVAVKVPSLSVDAHWQTMFALGVAVWCGGIVLRMYSIHILGRFFTYDVAISESQHVVERGPYHWIRHPSYLGGLLAMAGLGMTMTNWLAMFLPACFLGAGYVYRIHVEEQALVRGLGSAYSDYMRRTWRLIPYLF